MNLNDNSDTLNILLAQYRSMDFAINLMSTQIFHLMRKRRHFLSNISRLMKRRLIIAKAIIAIHRQPRKVWTHKRRSTFWEQEVPEKDDEFFKENFRMSRANFQILCNELQALTKHDTNFRKCIPLQKRIAIALYTLGSSAEYRSISNLFGIGKATVCQILKTFCEEVWQTLQPKYLNTYPVTQQCVKENVAGFEKLGFPQCIGAIDGCHIEVRPCAEDAVDYYNYKGWYSSVLLAVVDYRYRFLYINVGSPGRCNDSQIFENSSLKLEHQKPILRELSRCICGVDVPVVLIGDSAFRFSNIMMKPYPYNSTATQEEKNFNYALSKCRRVVENAFGHLKGRYRRIGKGLDNHIDNANLIIKSCCVLHNFLNAHNDKFNNHWLQSQDETRGREQPMHTSHISDFSTSAESIRNAISRYITLNLGVDDVDAEIDVNEDSNDEDVDAIGLRELDAAEGFIAVDDDGTNAASDNPPSDSEIDTYLREELGLMTP